MITPPNNKTLRPSSIEPLVALACNECGATARLFVATKHTLGCKCGGKFVKIKEYDDLPLTEAIEPPDEAR